MKPANQSYLRFNPMGGREKGFFRDEWFWRGPFANLMRPLLALVAADPCCIFDGAPAAEGS